MPIRILLVDDHLIVLKGLQFFLKTQTDMEVVGEAVNGKESVQFAESLKPDVVLMDLVMPVMDGIAATKRIKQSRPETKVIVLTTFADQDHVLPAIQAGAHGYLLKDADPEEILDAIRKVYEDEVLLHPQITKQLMKHLAGSNLDKMEKNKESAILQEDLTDREKEVLCLIAAGRSNKQIAADLIISEKTVKTHVSHILSKLDVTDRTQAAIYAMKIGLVE